MFQKGFFQGTWLNYVKFAGIFCGSTYILFVA